MLRTAVFLSGAIMLAHAGAASANDQVLRAPAPGWAKPSELMEVPEDAAGLLFVRRNDVLVHLDEQGQSNYVGYRVKILHPNALELGNLSIAWKPSAGAATVHVIRVHRAGQVIDVLETASFEVLRREDQLEAASLDGISTAIFRVADLRVDDELEVGLTIRTSDPTLRDTAAGLLLVPPQPQPGRFALGLSWQDGQEPVLQLTPDIAASAGRSARSITLSFDNPVPLSPPNGAPPRYQWQRILEFSDFPDWAAVSARFSPLYRQAATLDANSPLKDEVRRIAADHSDPLARARAGLMLVQQQVRYVYVGIGGGNLTPATAEETWQRRYGDCKGKSTLLLALLAELGVDAEAVLVNNSGGDDGMDERLPNAGLFDHILVKATIDGRGYWLDGTLPPVAEPSLAPIAPYRWVLPLTSRGSSLQKLDWQPHERPMDINLFEIDARVGFDQPARITSTTILRGIDGLRQHVQLSALTQAQLLGIIRQQGTGSTWQTIDTAEWRYDIRAQASMLTIGGTGTVDWDSDSDGTKSLILPGGGFSPPERRVRPSEQSQTIEYFNEPTYSCHVTTVRLPEGTRSSQWSFNSVFDTHVFGRNYYRAFEQRDGTVRMIRGSRVEQQEISAESAGRDNDRISTFDNSMARIDYNPNGGNKISRASVRVPATYEIDWTLDDVPCLSRRSASDTSPSAQ